MPTQEERVTALERTTQEYRPVLQGFAYEITMVKGLIVEQTGITQELRRDMDDVKGRLAHIEEQMVLMRQQLDTIISLLRPSQ
jgi:hypothetical protein